jgi:hypothetical protein
MPPPIQERKALINCLGVTILSKTKLVLEVHAKGTKLVSVGATEHEGGKVFIMDDFDCLRSLQIRRIRGILVNPSIFHVLQHGVEKGRNNSHCTKATICFNGLNVSKKLAVVGMVIDAGFLVVGEKTFMGCNGHHYTLNLGII